SILAVTKDVQDAARGELRQMSDDRARITSELTRELGRIDQQHAEIDRRGLEIDSRADAVRAHLVNADERLKIVDQQLERAQKYNNSIHENAVTAQNSADEVTRLAHSTSVQTDAAKLAMHEFLKRFQQLSQDAAVVTEYAPLVRSLSNMNV